MINGTELTEKLIYPSIISSFILGLISEANYIYPFYVSGLVLFFSICGHLCLSLEYIKREGLSEGIRSYGVINNLPSDMMAFMFWVPVITCAMYTIAVELNSESFTNLLDLWSYLTGSWLYICLAFFPFLYSGIIRWSELTFFDDDGTEKKWLKRTAFTISCVCLGGYYGGISVAVFTAISSSLGQVLIPPLLDLYWNCRNYNSPFKSFFLSKARKLGPSLKKVINESVHSEGYSIEYDVPPKNASPKSHHGIDLVRLRKPATIEDKGGSVNIIELNKYYWEYFTGSRYFQAFSSGQAVYLTVCEVSMSECGAISFQDKMVSALACLVSHCMEVNWIVEERIKLEVNDVVSINSQGQQGIHISLVGKWQWSEDQRIHIILYPVSSKRWVAFYLDSHVDNSDIILDRIIESVKVRCCGVHDDHNTMPDFRSFDFSDLPSSTCRLAKEIVKRRELEREEQDIRSRSDGLFGPYSDTII